MIIVANHEAHVGIARRRRRCPCVMPVSHAYFASLFNQLGKYRANSGRIESQEDDVVRQCLLNVTYALAYNGSRSVATIASATDTEGKVLKLHQGQDRICVNPAASFNAIHCIRDCITRNGDNGCQNSYYQAGIYHQYQLHISSISSTCHMTQPSGVQMTPVHSECDERAFPRRRIVKTFTRRFRGDAIGSVRTTGRYNLLTI